jgi:hypothetical protein
VRRDPRLEGLSADDLRRAPLPLQSGSARRYHLPSGICPTPLYKNDSPIVELNWMTKVESLTTWRLRKKISKFGLRRVRRSDPVLQ